MAYLLDTPCSLSGCNIRFLYWTSLKLQLVAIFGSYIGQPILMWLQSSVRIFIGVMWLALSLRGSNYDPRHSTRYLWPQPSPAPTYCVTLYSGQVLRKFPICVVLFSCFFSHDWAILSICLCLYIALLSFGFFLSQSVRYLSLNIQGDAFKPQHALI